MDELLVAKCRDALSHLELLELAAREAANVRNVNPYHMMNPDGTLVLVPIITAKANLLAALVAASSKE